MKSAETQAASQTHKDSLSRMPDEILIDIAEYLLDDPDECKENHHKKINQGTTLTSGKMTTLWTYQHKPESPIMTSFQSFSLLNRRMYSICRPIIWKSLKFPSEISSPMSFWNEELLPKHGSHVEVVDVGLRSQWLQTPTVRDENRNQNPHRSSEVNKIKFIREDKEFWEVDSIHSDNLNVHAARDTLGVKDEDIMMRELYGLSPENLIKVLSRCQNLTTLCLNCPGEAYNRPTMIAMRNLSHHLILLFSDLGRLRNLKIRGPHLRYASIFAQSFIEPISHLTLLESLELTHVAAVDGSEVDKLATCLYNLKNLKQLILKEVDIIDGSWCCHKAPPQLRNVSIRDCFQLYLSDVPFFISEWAPQLTHLELKFHEETDIVHVPEHEFDPEINQFCLPALTHLTIWPHDECHYIHCFASCKNLCHLTFYHLPRYNPINGSYDEDQITEFSSFITKNVFPNLKMIDLHVDHEEFPLEPDMASEITILEDFCKSKSIVFSVVPDQVETKLLHTSMLFSA